MRGKVFRSGGLFRSVQLLLLAVLVGSFLAPALPAQQASAKRLSEVDNLRTQARIWSEYQLLAAKKCKWGNPDRAAIDRPSWFSGTANAGLLIEDKDGKMECKNSTWLSEVVGTLSGSSDFYAVFDKIKYDNGINPPPGQFPSKVNNVPAYLRQFVDLSDSEVKAAKYVILFNAFTSPSGCSAKPLSGTATPSNQTKYVIKTADGGKQVKDVPYVIDNGKRGDAVRVGFGFGSADGGGDGAIKCENIASLLKSSDLANAVVAWKTAHPNSEVDLGSSGGGTTKKTCESVSKNPISWIFCPLVKLLDGIISALDKGIQNLLIIDESNYNNEGVKNAWATMRNIALALLLPFMLVMVGGTALGAGPFDPYTVKRALPRLIFAAIYITISFPLTTFLVELSNAAGAGLMGIVSFAFTGANDDITLASLLSAGEAAEIFGSLIIGGGAVAAATLSVGVFASLALVAAGGLFIGYMILILRQVVILAAIILAPIAILSWIFPGNDKLWKLWRESFEKALLFFIIFMAILAMGRAFAYIVSQSGATSLAGPLKPFIIVVAYVGPYLLIRQIVSASGAALATLGGMVNDRSRGFFDRQRNWRQRADGTAGESARQLAPLQSPTESCSWQPLWFGASAERQIGVQQLPSSAS
ncbi:hypothetical protein CR970_01100 [Candidatus Saccharibacteria bacterium]|nr:MAG: hypothetical protein CR970_01100 [Candidatus Saccharibacteria bacterium]